MSSVGDIQRPNKKSDAEAGKAVRSVVFIVVGVVVAIVLVPAIMIGWMSTKVAIEQAQMPDIEKNLPMTVDEARSEFSRRVVARYPTGIAEDALVAQLKADRFTSFSGVGTGNAFAEASYEPFPCKVTAFVSWETNSAHLATIISGDYWYDCP